jgi:hypothetical protein
MSEREQPHVDEARAQLVERGFVDHPALALPDERFIRHEPEPLKVLENRRLMRGPAAMPVVIFEPKRTRLCGSQARATPDVNRVDDVAEVQMPVAPGQNG